MTLKYILGATNPFTWRNTCVPPMHCKDSRKSPTFFEQPSVIQPENLRPVLKLVQRLLEKSWNCKLNCQGDKQKHKDLKSAEHKVKRVKRPNAP